MEKSLPTMWYKTKSYWTNINPFIYTLEYSLGWYKHGDVHGLYYENDDLIL